MKSSGRFIMINLAAFHILLAKFLEDFTLSSINLISFPGALPVASINLRASAPYWSMITSGSIPLPRDLDIFLPCESLTRPWIRTVSNGFCFMFSMPATIILDTQNGMIS